VTGVHRHVALDALPVVEADQKADDAAPVVADEVHALDPQRVEHAHDVVGELLLAVAARRRLAPAEAAQVQCEYAVTTGEQRHERAPRPPVLGPAVHEQHGRRGAVAELGDVQARAADIDVVVLDPVERWHVRLGHRARRLPSGDRRANAPARSRFRVLRVARIRRCGEGVIAVLDLDPGRRKSRRPGD
jgi:hypothetical protein